MEYRRKIIDIVNVRINLFSVSVVEIKKIDF